MEATKLKDKLDEMNHVAEKLHKAEQMIERLKKRMEDGSDVKNQLKVFHLQIIICEYRFK